MLLVDCINEWKCNYKNISKIRMTNSKAIGSYDDAVEEGAVGGVVVAGPSNLRSCN